MRINRTITALVAALAVGLPVAIAAPAQATMFDKVTHYEGTWSPPGGTEELCGMDVGYRVDFKGAYLIRAGKGKQAGAFFLHDKRFAVETFTNEATGRWFTVSVNVVVQDVKATRVDGPIFEFVTHEVGQVTVRDMNGTPLLRDRGRIAWNYLFDTGGDDVPGGTYLDELGVQVSGPHPIYDLSDEDFCAAVIPLIG